MDLRPAADLAAAPDPAWPLVRAWTRSTGLPVEVLDVDEQVGLEVLHRLQVTAASTLGALALHTGGVLADHGWFRLLGGGGHGLPDLATASGITRAGTRPSHLVVGFDAVGGRFAIDGGGLGTRPGEVCYLGPDTLAWEGLGGGHADLVHAALTGGLAETFRPLRWPGWEREVAALEPATGMSLYPPPFSQQGRDVASVSRRQVPLTELHSFYDAAARTL